MEKPSISTKLCKNAPIRLKNDKISEFFVAERDKCSTGRLSQSFCIQMYHAFEFFIFQGPELMNKYVGESERAVREVRKGRLWITLDTKLPWLSNSSLLMRLPLKFLKNSSWCKLRKEENEAAGIFSFLLH